jgi:pimeloyl-ACP methyl ester carboxylesterase
MSVQQTSAVQVPGPFRPNPVIADGQGQPVVFLHGPFGQEWTGFLEDLAQGNRVYAPANPGSDDDADLLALSSIPDLVLYYDDLFDSLGLETIDLVGHSFGGMVAAEFAATMRHRVRRLVLIDPLGLWRDDAPIADYVAVSDEKRLELLYADPETGKEATATDDAIDAKAAHVRSILSLASSSHFVWPIPDRGLVRRLRRITADTLIVWGDQDRVADPVYADDFAQGIEGARTVIIKDAGHVPHVEQRAEVTAAVREFLSAP